MKKHFHFAGRICRQIATLVLIFGMIGLVAGFVWLNQHGFPGEWGHKVQEEFAKRGLFVEFTSLQLDFQRGVVAREVRIFEGPAHQKLLFTASEIQLDLDPSKALRGIFQFEELQVESGRILMADPDGKPLEVSDFSGDLSLSESGLLRIRQAHGTLRGVEINLRGDLQISLDKSDLGKPLSAGRERLIRNTLAELDRWQFNPQTPPKLRLNLSGGEKLPGGIGIDFHLTATDLERENYRIRKLAMAGELRGTVLNLSEMAITDRTGLAEGRGIWHLERRSGKFHLTSQLDLIRFVRICFGTRILENFSSETVPELAAEGTVTHQEDGSWDIKLIGKAALNRFRFLDTGFESLDSDFSWQNGDLYLQDLQVKHQGGQFDGKIMVKKDRVQYQAKSTLPLEAYDPLIRTNPGLQRTLSELGFTETSALILDATGSLNRENLRDWQAKGRAYARNFTFKGEAIQDLAADYQLTSGEAIYKNLRGHLADEDYTLARRFNSGPSQEIRADQVTYRHLEKMTYVQNLRGTFWPASLVKLFAPDVAELLTKTVRLHQPPTLALSGAFDGKRPFNRTAINIGANPNGPVDFTFLDKNLTLTHLQTEIFVRGPRTDLKKLSFQTLGAPFSGNLSILNRPGKPNSFRGEMMWTKLPVVNLAQTYQLGKMNSGLLTGRFEFSGTEASARDLNGNGIIALEKGDLVSLPVLGPLSPLIAGVLGDRRAGYEQAKNASMNFFVKDGILRTNDFFASSASVVLTGDGWADLAANRIDLTIRLNARGLLGQVTLPLKPFNGLFQFRGTGKYTKPTWNAAPFTPPRAGNEDPLFKPAARAKVLIE